MGAYSKLHDHTYHEIRRHFPHFSIKENIRPEWLRSSNLTKLELDIYIEDINTAIEIQGKQHYVFVEHFHKTYDGFKAQLKRDKEKRELCYGKGIKLVEVAEEMDVKNLIDDINQLEKLKEPEVSKYSHPEQPRVIKVKSSKTVNNEIILKRPKFSIQHRKALNKKRKELRRKRRLWMISRGLIPPPIKMIRLPGSERQRAHARKLYCSKITNNIWFVWGGKYGIHRVTKADAYTCDCFRHKETGILCSHIIRAQMYNGEFPVIQGLPNNYFHCP